MTRTRGRVLIVDDQPANVHVLASALEDAYELFFATSGAEALDLASRQPIDLILLDVVMPGTDGFDVCRRLKADDRTRPILVVFVTARGEVQDETRGFDVGGVDYITKPISPPVVRARVRTHLALKDARDMLERMASIDALTGVANRRRFDDYLEQEWRRAQRAADWISLALLDVDHFKQFNDGYGHARGDQCLAAVAEALAGSGRRPGDLVARYGGEEFALVLPSTDPLGARIIGQTALARVEALAIEHRGSLCADRVTLSLGMVSVVPAAGEPTAALETADRLLYEAKEGGRRHGVHLDLVTGAKRTLAPGSQNTEVRDENAG